MIARRKSGTKLVSLVKIFFEEHRASQANGLKPIFLLEWSKGKHDALIYAATHLAAQKTLGSRTVAFWPDFFLGCRSRIWASAAGCLLRHFYVSDLALTFQQLGISDLVVPGLTRAQRRATREIFREVISELSNPTDLEDLRLDGVLVGDLFYDSVLKDLRARTLPLGSRKCNRNLRRSIGLYIFWRDWLQDKDLVGAAGRHASYRNGLVLRQAARQGAVSMQIGREQFSKITNSHPWAGPNYASFPAIFSSLSQDLKEEALEVAKLSLDERLVGRWSEATYYMLESAYGPETGEKIFAENGRRRIVAFSHAFFDAPHANGPSIFPDYWEWLNHIGRLSRDSEYDWFVKPHPAGGKEDLGFLEDLVVRYDSLQLIPAKTSNSQILSEGCDLALTLYGSVGVEFAWRGVPVITGGAGPSQAYNFVYHPRDVEHFERLISHLTELRVRASRNDILQYEFMLSFFYGRHILFDGDEDNLNYFTRKPHHAKSFISRIVGIISRFMASDEKALPAIAWREKSGRL